MHPLPDSLEEFGRLLGREVLEVDRLEVAPDALIRIVLEAIGRKGFDAKAVRVVRQENVEFLALVQAAAVDEHDEFSFDVAQEVPEELDDIIVAEGFTELELEVHLLRRAHGADEVDLLPAAEVVA